MICTKTYKYSYLYNFVQVSFAEDPMRPERARRREKRAARAAMGRAALPQYRSCNFGGFGRLAGGTMPFSRR